MPFAVTLRLDRSSALPIEAMWQALAAAGIDADRHTLGYGPHITLGIYPDATPADVLRGALQAAVPGWDALPISVAGFGLFPGPAPILWAIPVVTPALLARHAAWHAAVPAVTAHPHYRPGAWVPHITLSGTLRDPAAALQAVLPLWRPLDGWLDCAELVRFRPVAILHSRSLRT